jgi:KaiC/GvpD/RAD55 family RecA-like ATPase
MALGHSSFCKALEAGTEFEITRTMAMYDEAVRHFDVAADYYLKAGFENTSNYAKATQHLFDAYVFMENAKLARDPAKQAKYYSMAEKVLQVAADYFLQAKHQDKTDQVQRLLRKVKEERALALSLSEIFHAPTITSSTTSFSTISPSQEEAVGLERFEHADIQAKLIQHETEIKVGNTVNLEIQIVNVGKELVSLTKIENIVPEGFQLVGKPDYCLFENMQLTMKGKRLDPLKTDEIKLALRSFKKGSVEIKPRIVCVDWTGHQMSYSPEPLAFNVSGAALPGRVPTGYADLDNLLLGGIPENYAVILASPSSDEREQLIKKFLETGTRNGQTTFYVTAEAGDIAHLAEEFQSNFYVFVCNSRADAMIKNLPNVSKLRGVESLTDIDIALVKSIRMLDSSQSGPKRACITIVSDVLLQHHAIITRKWLSGLLPDLRARGFTTLAVINPQMHPQEEVQAILGLFEGEIRITEKETDRGLEKLLRIRKLHNQRYLENEIEVTREKLES